LCIFLDLLLDVPESDCTLCVVYSPATFISLEMAGASFYELAALVAGTAELVSQYSSSVVMLEGFAVK
jgi:hypothetical protein